MRSGKIAHQIVLLRFEIVLELILNFAVLGNTAEVQISLSS